MTTKRTARLIADNTPMSFHAEADRQAELARLDNLIDYFTSRQNRRLVKFAKVRRRKVTGWVIGA